MNQRTGHHALRSGAAGRGLCGDCRCPVREIRAAVKTEVPGGFEVTVENCLVHECPRCGSRDVRPPDEHGLRRAVLAAVARRVGRLTGKEIRFIRSMLGCTSRSFARLLSVHPSTLSRIENSRQRLGLGLERLVRVLALRSLEGDPGTRDLLGDLDQGVGTGGYLVARMGPEGWRVSTRPVPEPLAA